MWGGRHTDTTQATKADPPVFTSTKRSISSFRCTNFYQNTPDIGVVGALLISGVARTRMDLRFRSVVFLQLARLPQSSDTSATNISGKRSISSFQRTNFCKLTPDVGDVAAILVNGMARTSLELAISKYCFPPAAAFATELGNQSNECQRKALDLLFPTHQLLSKYS